MHNAHHTHYLFLNLFGKLRLFQSRHFQGRYRLREHIHTYSPLIATVELSDISLRIKWNDTFSIFLFFLFPVPQWQRKIGCCLVASIVVLYEIYQSALTCRTLSLQNRVANPASNCQSECMVLKFFFIQAPQCGGKLDAIQKPVVL